MANVNPEVSNRVAPWEKALTAGVFILGVTEMTELTNVVPYGFLIDTAVALGGTAGAMVAFRRPRPAVQ